VFAQDEKKNSKGGGVPDYKIPLEEIWMDEEVKLMSPRGRYLLTI
tara:strand:+ start:447 stop:581 length:135 start_codon:yes stop_codon:yes gene_type:complete